MTVESLPPGPAVAATVAAFEKLQIRYFLGGSLASSMHGESRTTQDADIVAGMAPSKAAPFVELLGEDFYADADTISAAIRSGTGFNLIHVPSMFRINVFPPLRPLDREAMKRAQPARIPLPDLDRAVLTASPEDIILNKLDWFRRGGETSERQWLDVLSVMKVQHGRLEEDYLDRWAEEMGVADLLQKVRAEAAEALR